MKISPYVSFLAFLQSSLNGSASNLQDGSGRSFASSYTGQPGSPSPGFHHAAGECDNHLGNALLLTYLRSPFFFHFRKSSGTS